MKAKRQKSKRHTLRFLLAWFYDVIDATSIDFRTNYIGSDFLIATSYLTSCALCISILENMILIQNDISKACNRSGCCKKNQTFFGILFLCFLQLFAVKTYIINFYFSFQLRTFSFSQPKTSARFFTNSFFYMYVSD